MSIKPKMLYMIVGLTLVAAVGASTLRAASSSASRVYLIDGGGNLVVLNRLDWSVKAMWSLGETRGLGAYVPKGAPDGPTVVALSAMTKPGFERLFLLLPHEAQLPADLQKRYRIVSVALPNFDFRHVYEIPVPQVNFPTMTLTPEQDQLFVQYSDVVVDLAANPPPDHSFTTVVLDTSRLEEIRKYQATYPNDINYRSAEPRSAIPFWSNQAYFVADRQVLFSDARVIRFADGMYTARRPPLLQALGPAQWRQIEVYAPSGLDGDPTFIHNVVDSKNGRALVALWKDGAKSQYFFTVDLVSGDATPLVKAPLSRGYLLPGAKRILIHEIAEVGVEVQGTNGGLSNRISLRDVETGKLLHEIQVDELKGGVDHVIPICMLPDDVVMFRGDQSQLVIVNLVTGEVTIPLIDFWAEAVGGCILVEEER